MAETIVQITEGAGKKLHAWDRVIGANTVLDEVIILGENYLPSYTVVAAVSPVTANSHILQIMAGATNRVRIRRIEVSQFAPAAAAAVMTLEVRRLTTAGTGGTAVTPATLDPGDSPSGATAMTLPTAKGTEGVIIAYGAPFMWQTIGVSSTFPEPNCVWDFDGNRSKPLIIAAGTSNGIAIKNTVAVNTNVLMTVWFSESSFA